MKRSKIVYQYDLDKNFIRKWDSIMDVYRELGYDPAVSVKHVMRKLHIMVKEDVKSLFGVTQNFNMFN